MITLENGCVTLILDLPLHMMIIPSAVVDPCWLQIRSYDPHEEWEYIDLPALNDDTELLNIRYLVVIKSSDVTKPSYNKVTRILLVQVLIFLGFSYRDKIG